MVTKIKLWQLKWWQLNETNVKFQPNDKEETLSVLGRDKEYTVKYSPRELPKAKGYIWPYILRQVLIRTVYRFHEYLNIILVQSFKVG